MESVWRGYVHVYVYVYVYLCVHVSVRFPRWCHASRSWDLGSGGFTSVFQESWSRTASSGKANDSSNREYVVLDLFSNWKRCKIQGFFRWLSLEQENSTWTNFGVQNWRWHFAFSVLCVCALCSVSLVGVQCVCVGVGVGVSRWFSLSTLLSVCVFKTPTVCTFIRPLLCTGTTPKCVTTCGRGACTRGDVLDGHTEVYQRATPHTGHTPQTPHALPHTTSHTTSHGDRQRETEKEDREREMDKRKTRRDGREEKTRLIFEFLLNFFGYFFIFLLTKKGGCKIGTRCVFKKFWTGQRRTEEANKFRGSRQNIGCLPSTWRSHAAQFAKEGSLSTNCNRNCKEFSSA